jgi:hypothetical protein
MRLSLNRFLFCLILCCSYNLIPANAQSQIQCSINEPLFRNGQYQEWWDSFVQYARLAETTPPNQDRRRIARFERARQIANEGLNVSPYLINKIRNSSQENRVSIAYMLSYVYFVTQVLDSYARTNNQVRPVEYQQLSAARFKELRNREYQEAKKMYNNYYNEKLSGQQKQELSLCLDN